ncbi:carbon storage regulator [Marinobacterium sp. MBR-109]|jgi:carbon storage regulator|uniref:carbon storage regulator n=1 Tax=Marinobacterium sp. MBR-109 TaxID=3156462 RepID=UPI00339405DF
MPRLTLNRKEGEVLIIDHDIRVIVQRARNGKAKITIDAPDDVDVIREELEGMLEIDD